jgi:hypothetical protein
VLPLGHLGRMLIDGSTTIVSQDLLNALTMDLYLQ